MISEVLVSTNLAGCISVSEKLYDYLCQLYQKNQEMNLVSVHSFDELIQTHLYDSLVLFRLLPDLFHCGARPLKGMDIGSGGGFPALPLSIVLQNSQWIMVESIQKKANFLKQTVHSLELYKSIIIPFRLEEFIKSCPIPPLDFVTIRAVGKIDIIYPYIEVFRKKHIPVILWKHPDEIEQFNEKRKEKWIVQDYPYPVSNGQKHILLVRST